MPPAARARPRLPLSLCSVLLLAACIPGNEGAAPTPEPSACGPDEAPDERGRCLPEACAGVSRGSEAEALHVAEWGDAIAGDGSPERPYRSLEAALRSAATRPPEERPVFLDVGAWLEPVRIGGTLSGIHLQGRCREVDCAARSGRPRAPRELPERRPLSLVDRVRRSGSEVDGRVPASCSSSSSPRGPADLSGRRVLPAPPAHCGLRGSSG